MLILDKAYVCEYCEIIHRTDKVFSKCFACGDEICESCVAAGLHEYCLGCWRRMEELDNTIIENQ